MIYIVLKEETTFNNCLSLDEVRRSTRSNTIIDLCLSVSLSVCLCVRVRARACVCVRVRVCDVSQLISEDFFHSRACTSTPPLNTTR